MKKTNIIGAGLAGLSAGIYLQESGVETELFELADWAGGMCTSWVRSGYRFDGCVHWMVGTKPGNGFYKLYREVDALKEDTVIYSADFIRLEIKGIMYEVPMEIRKFRAFLQSLSKNDDEKIDEFCKNIEIMIHTQVPTGMPSGLPEMIGIIKDSRGFLSLAKKYLGKTIGELAQSFHSRTIRDILVTLMPENLSAEGIIMMLGARMSGNAGYPMGGSLEIIKRMEAKYRSLGGKIRFHAKVDEIVVENGNAVGIKSNGKLYPADAVIAACDAYDTLEKMLGGNYRHPQLDTMLETAPLFPAIALVSFGLNRKFDIPYYIHYECIQDIPTSPDTAAHTFSLRSFEFDSSAAPENASSIMVDLTAPLAYWQNLRTGNINEYKKQKQQLAEAAADEIERRIPGFKDSIVVTDVSTPATYVRLANLYKGSFEGFLPTPAALKTSVRKTVPGVGNLILCGQWTAPGGGICSAVRSGKDAAHLALRSMKK